MAMFLVGLYDDTKKVRVRHKLYAQFIGATIITLAGARVTHISVQDLFSINLGWISYPLTFLWVLGVTNAINLIDGLDGLAGGISAIACAAFAVLATVQGNFVIAILMLGLFGSLTGFLFFNFHPARIFMGDCGSLFLGFTIAAVSVLTASKTHSFIGIGFPILVLGVPIFDTLFSMLRRFLGRRGLTSPDKGHFHHRLLQRGFTQQQVVFVAYAITIVISSLGMLMLRTRGINSVLLFVICLILHILIFRTMGAVRLRETVQGIRDRSTLNQVQRVERKSFEEAQLHLKGASSFDEWWNSICIAAKTMEFASVSLEIEARDGNKRVLLWNSNKHPKPDSDSSTLQINVPIDDRRRDGNPSFGAKIPARESLEAAGRKLALFTRLVEEHGLCSI
jgi:UDP-GlcNAc:undecaprenyl-phosphate/decaprenyl-phosphate GlcNAc-1-phosphate transferase